MKEKLKSEKKTNLPKIDGFWRIRELRTLKKNLRYF